VNLHNSFSNDSFSTLITLQCLLLEPNFLVFTFIQGLVKGNSLDKRRHTRSVAYLAEQG